MGTKLCLSYKKISIRNLKSRWGSCSKTGNLSFSLLLSMLPVDVIDYIIVHELDASCRIQSFKEVLAAGRGGQSSIRRASKMAKNA